MPHNTIKKISWYSDEESPQQWILLLLHLHKARKDKESLSPVSGWFVTHLICRRLLSEGGALQLFSLAFTSKGVISLVSWSSVASFEMKASVVLCSILLGLYITHGWFTNPEPKFRNQPQSPVSSLFYK